MMSFNERIGHCSTRDVILIVLSISYSAQSISLFVFDIGFDFSF